MADSMSADRTAKKKQTKKRTNGNISILPDSSSSSPFSAALSDEELLEALARNQRGRGFFDTLGRIGKAISTVKNVVRPIRNRYSWRPY